MVSSCLDVWTRKRQRTVTRLELLMQKSGYFDIPEAAAATMAALKAAELSDVPVGSAA